MNNRKEGYKQTKIGVIPEDWEVKTLGEFSLIKSGESPSKFLMNTSGIPYFKVEQLNNGTKYTSETPYYIQISNPVKKGSIVFPKRGASIMLNKIRIFSNDSYLDTNLMALTLDDCVESEFIFYVLSYFGLDKIADTTSIPQINNKHINPFLVSLPPTLAEQTAIATALSDADGLITGLEKLIAKKRNIKQGAMQQLLKPKEGWEVKKLGELGECIIGLTYKPDNVKETGTLVLRSSNVQGNILKYDDNVFVDCEISEKLTNKENDILICVRNGSRNLIGKCALIKGNAIGETFGAFMSVFRSPFNEFVFILFQSDIIKKQIDEHLGATINQITNKSLNSFEIPFPPKEEQTRIATILSDMDAELSALEQKLEKYKKVKLGMMQELLTGKTRLV